jgi:hypothetical protein
VSDLVRKDGMGEGRSLRPSRVSIWPVESGGYGVDFTYHGATGFKDAETALAVFEFNDLKTTFVQELDGAWTVRLGPLTREHVRQVLDQYAL